MKKDGISLNLDDRTILLDLAVGKKHLLETFYRRHAGKVLGFCHKRGLTKQQSEDICQIVFMQLYRKSAQYKSEFEPLAWLFVITKSEMRDYLKKQKIEIPIDEVKTINTTNNVDSNLEIANEVTSLLAQLPEREQKVLKMHYLDEMTYTEISNALKLKESALRKIVSRSLQFLSQLKGEHS